MQSALSSLLTSSVPRQKSQEETQDKGGHTVTLSPGRAGQISALLQELQDPPWRGAYLERVQDSAVVVDHHRVSLLPLQPWGTLQAGMNPVKPYSTERWLV